MTIEHAAVLCHFLKLAKKNPNMEAVLTKVCNKWSDGNCKELVETYAYLVNSKTNASQKFINDLVFAVQTDQTLFRR